MLISIKCSCYVAAQVGPDKIIQNLSGWKLAYIMSCFVEFVHPFDRFFYFISRAQPTSLAGHICPISRKR